MAIAFENKEFGKQGRGNEGEKFTAKQLTEDSVAFDSLDSLLADFAEVTGNDLSVMRQVVILGYNKYSKNLAGGTDEASKTAALLVKAGLAGGKSKAELAAGIRNGTFKISL